MEENKMFWCGKKYKKLARRLKDLWISPIFFEIFPDFYKNDSKVEYYFKD